MDPFSVMFKKHLLAWVIFESLRKEEQQKAILKLLLQTINSRKRQYRKCQFCDKKVAAEHRIDKNTCHVCASKHLGVVY